MSSGFDLVVRGGLVATPEGLRRADLGIAGGRLAAIAPEVSGPTQSTVDAGGAIVFPGIIDAHVHFNEPGREDWEGLETGSGALAAGGGTCFFDMPLNSEPPVLDAASFQEKRALAERKSRVDFGLWGGLVPANLDRLAELRDAGAVGLKAFLCDSGIGSFPRVSPSELGAGMRRAAELGLPVAVHAEDQALAAKLTAAQLGAGRRDCRAYLDSRPVRVELEAIRIALDLAGETRCALHVVHVSSPDGIALISAARKRGVDVTAETCPHYLLLNERDAERLGALAKCAPPLRDEGRRAGLWRELRAGRIDTVGSDHSPAPPEMRSGDDFFALWGGIAGCQHGFELLFSETGIMDGADWAVFAAVLARNAALRFRVDDRKGLLAEGLDADFSVVRLGPGREIHRGELLNRHRLSPYIGRRSRARMTRTFVRGHAVCAEGRLTRGPAVGQFVPPRRTNSP